MAKTSPELESIDVRNQAFIEGLKLGEHKKFAPTLKRISSEVGKAILARGEILETKKQRNALISEVNSIQQDAYADYLMAHSKFLGELGVDQADFEADSYEKVVVNFESKRPTAVQVATAYKVNPLQVENYAGNPLLESYIKDMTDKEIARVNKAISDGYSQGLTNNQILTNIRGTKANGYNDGILKKVNNANASMVRTSIQHVSTQARQETMKQNSDLVKGYKIIVTFDDRTTTLCYDIGQQDKTYKVGRGPLPPLHINACLKGTEITTVNGLAPIEDVAVGDRVLTHTGRYMRVRAVMARKESKKAYKLVDSFGKSISLTGEHPVLTLIDGWKEAGDIKPGDVVFNNSEKLVEVDRFSSSLVKNTVLLDSHNIETGITNELVSYGIFSCAAGVTSSVNLNNSVANKKISNENIAYDKLKLEFNTSILKGVDNNLLVKGGVVPVGDSLASDGLSFELHIVNGVVSLHSVARLFCDTLSGFGLNSCPMVFAARVWAELIASLNGILSASGFDSKLNASLSDSVVREVVLSLDESKTLAFAPMLKLDKVDNGFVTNAHGITPNDKWYTSTITSIAEYHIDEYVYNLSVAEDETYVANGMLVHNCRDTISSVLSEKFDFLDKGATRASKGAEGGKQVSAKLGSYDWMLTQPKAFQDASMGPTRAKLLRDGGISPTEYAKLSTNSRFKTLTLKEMQALRPDVFEAAGVEL